MIDINRMLTSVLAGGGPLQPGAPQQRGSVPQAGGAPRGGGIGDFLSNNIGALGSGALAGGLAGTLLTSKHTRKLAGTALQVGAAAVLGGLAYKAYQNYRDGRPIVPQSVSDMIGAAGGQTPTPSQPEPAALPPPARPKHAGFLSRPQPVEADGILLLRAMIASAMADGRIDDRERAALIDRVEASGMSDEERTYLESLIENPDKPAQLAALASGPEAASQIYLAAYVAVDADTPQETAWLNELARCLNLEPALRQNLEAAARAPA
jgi:uncharacterized membrane protein YebE (DUF533 family)